MKIPEFLEIRGDPFFPNSAVEEVSHVFRAAFFPNFEPFKIHYFHSHLLASRGQDYFFSLISICFDIVFFPNSDKSNFDESKSLRIEIRKKSNVKTY